MSEQLKVLLHVYDVTALENDSALSVTRLNSITRELNLGGVFHGAIEINGVEWAFGYCERGSGVYCCTPKANPMYTYRETVDLGATSKPLTEVEAILQTLKDQWQGDSYDLLSRNCCHFCEALCAVLEVGPLPGWLNRFAIGADATLVFSQDVVCALRNLGQDISRTTSTSFTWMRESLSKAVEKINDRSTQSSPLPDTTAPGSPLPLAASRLLNNIHLTARQWWSPQVE